MLPHEQLHGVVTNRGVLGSRVQERVDKGVAGGYPFKYTFTVVKPNAKNLAIIADLIEHFKVHVHVSKVYPLEKARCAVAVLTTLKGRGPLLPM